MTGKIYPRNGFIGFDHIFADLERIHNQAKDTYPPHNVVKVDDLKFTVEIAVAGFSQDHIDIETPQDIHLLLLGCKYHLLLCINTLAVHS